MADLDIGSIVKKRLSSPFLAAVAVMLRQTETTEGKGDGGFAREVINAICRMIRRVCDPSVYKGAKCYNHCAELGFRGIGRR